MDVASSFGLLWQLRHPWLQALVAVACGVLVSGACCVFIF
jgi:hypothetical protein